MNGSINTVVALPGEAQPIIERFHLSPFKHSPFKTFRNANKERWLVISGVGKDLSEQACAHVAEVSSTNASTAWLNVGVGGHRSLPIGTILAAHKITDDTSGRTWYPPMIFDLPCNSSEVRTLKSESHNYPHDEIIEMEAAGFYEAASRYTSHELIHCLKVISDNEKSPRLKYNAVPELLAGCLDKIDNISSQLMQLSREQGQLNKPHPEMDSFLEKWAFTATQTHQLKNLLQRWSVINMHEKGFETAVNSCHNSKEVLALLSHMLDIPQVKAETL